MTADSAFDRLADVIVNYAIDYTQPDWNRDTTWSDVDEAIEAFARAVKEGEDR